jgi:hypothetical protein
MKKTNYVAFCEHCGLPRVFTDYAWRMYYKQAKWKVFYCYTCEKDNKLPEYLLKIIDEL